MLYNIHPNSNRLQNNAIVVDRIIIDDVVHDEIAEEVNVICR